METSGSRMVKTTCQLCHLACGMNVYLEDGRIVKVEGMPEHPLNQGFLCPKGEAVVEYVYAPDRLKYPMKRANGRWERISWNEALDTIASKLNQVKTTHGAGALGIAFGMSILLSGSVAPALIRRFAYSLGTPNCFCVERMCYRCRIIGYMLTYGRFRVADPENSKCIFLWAHNPTNSNPTLAQSIERAKEKGARLVVIDPRETPLAKESELHIRPRPGSDCALLLSVMNVIVSEKLYDEDFVANWTSGFDKLREHVRDYPPERVEGLTWVPAEDIRRVARIYATAKPACIMQGTNGLDQHATGLQNSRAVAILQAPRLPTF